MLIVLTDCAGDPVSIDPELIESSYIEKGKTMVHTSTKWTFYVRQSPTEIMEKVNNALKQNPRCPWRNLKRR